MRRIYKGGMFLTALMAFLLVLSACSAPGQANSPSPTPLQTLQNSASAMNKLQSVHFDLQASLATQLGSATSATPTAATPTTPIGNITFNVTGHGDAAGTDQSQVNLTLGNQPIVNVISKGQTVYVQTKDGQWFSVDKSKLKNGSQSFFSQSLAKHMADLTTLLLNAKLTDHGQETVNGESLDHITAVMDQQSLQALSSQLNGLLPANQQQAQNQLTKGTIDLWIDQSTSLIHQVKLDVMAQVDVSKMAQANGQGNGNTPMPASVEAKAQLNFSKFNQPVNIQAPSNATPLPQQ